MKNLGKIILICFYSATLLFAEVNVSVDRDQVSRGERVTFTLRVAGTHAVDIPPVERLCGVDIEGRMQSQKTVISNGKRLQELSLDYTFMPSKSCVIEPFDVTVDGKIEQTRAIPIEVSKISIQKDDPFIVGLMTPKTSVYVGEPFEMRVDLKSRQNVEALAESISLPESKNLWIKSEQKGQGHIKDRYKNRTNRYALSAQQSGKLTLGPLRWDLKVRSQGRDIWGTWLARSKTHTVFSNEIEMEVKPLPDGITLVGDLQIEAQVDKTEVNAGEAVNVTISLKGRANVEDISPFEIHVDGAQAFNEEPKINHYLESEHYFGTFSQKSALVAEHDFTIPEFTLSYMDVESDTVKTISTKPIPIRVLNTTAKKEEPLKISRPKAAPEAVVTQKSGLSILQGALILLLGMLLGVVLALIPWRGLRTSKKGQGKKVPAKVSKEVLQLLMAHMAEDREIERLVKELSENLYEGASHSIDMKRLKEIIKRLQV